MHPRRAIVAILAAAWVVLAILSASCSGSASISIAGISISSLSVTFPNQPVGTTSTAQTVTLTNTGTATLTITSVVVTGTNAGDFSVTNTCGNSVAPGAMCTASVTFTPGAPGSRTASVSITDNAAGSPQMVSLSGTGTALPTLTSVSPASGPQGSNVNVTLTGTNFVTPVTVNFGGAGVTVANVVVASATSITAQFQISPTAALGGQNVSVTTGGGTSGTQTFTVATPPPPTLTSVSPAAGVTGTNVNVTLTGTNFLTGATTVLFSGPGVTVANVVVTSSNTITAQFQIAAGATLGAQNVSVMTSGGTSGNQTFTVNPPLPTLTSVSPTSGVQGNAVPVTLTGTNFVAGSTINVPGGGGITVSATTVTSATTITATFTLLPCTPLLGLTEVSVGSGGFTVNV